MWRFELQVELRQNEIVLHGLDLCERKEKFNSVYGDKFQIQVRIQIRIFKTWQPRVSEMQRNEKIGRQRTERIGRPGMRSMGLLSDLKFYKSEL